MKKCIKIRQKKEKIRKNYTKYKEIGKIRQKIKKIRTNQTKKGKKSSKIRQKKR